MARRVYVEDSRITRKTGIMIGFLRDYARETQSEFSEKVGITQPELSAIEHGRRLAKPDVVQRIADRFGIRFEQVCGIEPIIG